ncbi:maleate cis-trans isomerase family protein [Saccharopolyspora pogona]|uniref:maleate cis-trans isomerase family protein n=1 Tax=Saccharopolyspora pogona TaxID=333966 RepID=UPI001CC23D3C|nr:maleate cis-trans isomerase [Saccharopolyspora pogona]
MQQRKWQADGWEPTVRIGLIVPHADVGPESEFRAMLPSSIALFGSRMHFSAMRAGGVMDPKIPHGPVKSFTDPPFADDAAELLAAAPIDAIGCGFTSSAYKLGVAGEAEFVDRVRERTRGIPLASTCHAATQALRSLDVRTLALVNPPWFDTELDDLGSRYFTVQGFEVVHHAPCGLPSSQRQITAEAMFNWVAEQVMPAKPDAVFIGGNGLRAIGVIDALEQQFDIPVLTANQVLLWYTLHLAAAEPEISGYGRLFDCRP